jgi:hypothetical protein
VFGIEETEDFVQQFDKNLIQVGGRVNAVHDLFHAFRIGDLPT